MEKSSSKLACLVILLIVASCSHVGEARGPVITFRCSTDADCVGEKCWCDTCYCQSSKRCACKIPSISSDAVIGAQVGKLVH
ncbi:hypothetical protein NC652_004653 [Populus alba x Populus x berolinensis]|nr:hypothetical protein NC652_004653 [Populus alba x Populus x berolinensis]